MYKSCQYCGGIHPIGYECPKKPKKVYKKNKYSEVNAEIKRFRSSKKWDKKRNEIQKRDNYLCQVCLRELYNAFDKYTYENLSVHHINKLSDRPDLKLDNLNLITLCSMHHTDADLNKIPIEVLLKIVEEQENK